MISTITDINKINNIQNPYDRAEAIQKEIDKGNITIVDLGVINGCHRYKFKWIKGDQQ